MGRSNLLLFHILMKFIVFLLKILHNKMEIESGKYGEVSRYNRQSVKQAQMQAYIDNKTIYTYCVGCMRGSNLYKRKF